MYLTKTWPIEIPQHFATLVASPTWKKGDDGRLLSPVSVVFAKKEENKKEERKKKNS